MPTEGRLFVLGDSAELIQSPKGDGQNAERSLRGRIGAYSLHAAYDSRELTAPARKAFLSRFAFEVDPEGQLLPEERERRAGHARKAYFTRLAYLSAKARRGKSGGRTNLPISPASRVRTPSMGIYPSPARERASQFIKPVYGLPWTL